MKNVNLWLETGNKPPQDMIKILSPAAKYFWANASILDIKDGVLYYKWDEGYIIRTLFVVPRAIRKCVLWFNHDSTLAGHPGITRTIQKVRKTCYWHKMTEDVTLYVKSCKECNTNKKVPGRLKPP